MSCRHAGSEGSVVHVQSVSFFILQIITGSSPLWLSVVIHSIVCFSSIIKPYQSRKNSTQLCPCPPCPGPDGADRFAEHLGDLIEPEVGVGVENQHLPLGNRQVIE